MFPMIGNNILDGVFKGLELLANSIKNKITELTSSGVGSKEYSSVKIEEIQDGYLVGPTEYVKPPTKKEGTSVRVYKCPIWKYYSVTYVNEKGFDSPSDNDLIIEAINDMTSSGEARDIIVQSIMSSLQSMFDQSKMKVTIEW